jgi:hypothetical protein
METDSIDHSSSAHDIEQQAINGKQEGRADVLRDAVLASQSVINNTLNYLLNGGYGWT